MRDDKTVRTYKIEVLRPVKIYTPGEGFGELALLSNQPWAATLRTMNEPVELVYLQKYNYKKILGDSF